MYIIFSNKNKEFKLPQLVPVNKLDKKSRQRIFQRNNPHPRINFPFQSGDRVSTRNNMDVDEITVL